MRVTCCCQPSAKRPDVYRPCLSAPLSGRRRMFWIWRHENPNPTMGNLPTGLPLYEAQKSEAQERQDRHHAGMPRVDPRKMGRLRQYIETEGSPFAPKIWYNLS